MATKSTPIAEPGAVAELRDTAEAGFTHRATLFRPSRPSTPGAGGITRPTYAPLASDVPCLLVPASRPGATVESDRPETNASWRLHLAVETDVAIDDVAVVGYAGWARIVVVLDRLPSDTAATLALPCEDAPGPVESAIRALL